VIEMVEATQVVVALVEAKEASDATPPRSKSKQQLFENR